MPEFPPLPFDRLNESDVREEVIAPLLRYLGYRSGTKYNVIREQSLRYPKISLGRKNPSRDPPLRGSADYILNVDGAIQWVIEAKAPFVEIGTEEVGQAWTYASHSEVRAVYFALCNGRELKVFQTERSPDASPVLSVTYDHLSRYFGKVAELLAPEALLRAFPDRAVDDRPPIGPALRSVVRITTGWIRFDYNSLGHAALNQLQTVISSGAVERRDDGCLVAYLKTMAPLRQFQEFNERLGLATFEMLSSDSVLSVDASRPTEFANERSIVLPAGEPLLDIIRWRQTTLPFNVRCHSSAIARGYLQDLTFSGRFVGRMIFPELENLVAELSGPFEVHLA